MNSDSIAGCLLGTAIGDALGLPYEGLSPRRAERMLGPPTRFRFLYGKGMVSDDTEHACLTWQALIDARGNDDQFATHLANRLRVWLLSLPAGTGMATARAILKLLLGWGPRHSGVFSAGNGPAMRAPILGAAIDDLDQLQRFVRIATRITHTDPAAEHGAFAVAIAAWLARREPVPDPARYFSLVADRLKEKQADALLRALVDTQTSLLSSEPTIEFAARLFGRRGVSGYVLQTVPVVVHAWLSFPRDYRSAVMSVIRCGGDADTTAAITGGIVGAGNGVENIPGEWIHHLVEWPRTVRWMQQLAKIDPHDSTSTQIDLPFWQIVPRNMVFLAVVLSHGFRRLFPPY